MDLLIAATAHAHSARLYTRNGGDLAGIEHLIESFPFDSRPADAGWSSNGPTAA